MASESKLTMQTMSRFEGMNCRPTLHLTRMSRINRFRLQNNFLPPGNRVQLHFFLVVDPDSNPPNIQSLSGAVANATVQAASTVEIDLVFGVPPSPEMQDRSICCITLPQIAAPAKGEHISVTLMCVVRLFSSVIADRSPSHQDFEWVAQCPVSVTSSWAIAVREHSSALFSANMQEKIPDFLDISTVCKLMLTRWTSIFGYLQTQDQRQEKSRGKFTEAVSDEEDGADEPEQLLTPRSCCFPELHQRHINDIIRLVHSQTGAISTSESPPALISKSFFCGADAPSSSSLAASGSKFVSLWTVFESLIEMVGRSVFIRQLFVAGQLFFLTPYDSIEFTAASLARLGRSSLLHLFRLSTSLTVPAVVLEILKVVDGTIQKVRPSPYVTVDQIVGARGHVYSAFTHLESVHHAVLSTLDPAHRLAHSLRPVGDPPPGSVGEDSRRVRCNVVQGDDLINMALKDPNSSLIDGSWWSSSAYQPTS